MEAPFLVAVGASALVASLMVAAPLLARGRSARRAAALAAEVWVVIAAWVILLQLAARALGAPTGAGLAGEMGDLASRASRLSVGELAGLALGFAICAALVVHLMWALRREGGGNDQGEGAQV